MKFSIGSVFLACFLAGGVESSIGTKGNPKDASTKGSRRFLRPANDDFCSTYPVIPIGGSNFYDTEGATAEIGEPSPGAGTGTGEEFSSCESLDGWCDGETDVENSVWFGLDAPDGVTSVTIEISGDGDAQMALWEIDISKPCSIVNGIIREIAANDDSGSKFSPLIKCAPVTPGAAYSIQVDGFDGSASSGEIRITECFDSCSLGYKQCGYQIYDSTADNICCDGVLYEGTTHDACCGTESYDSSSTDICCEGVLTQGTSDNACCGTESYDSTSDICCEGVLTQGTSDDACCGTESYNSESGTDICCGIVLKRDITAGAFDCCGFLIIPTGTAMSCCDGTPFVDTCQTCCEGSIVDGTVCPPPTCPPDSGLEGEICADGKNFVCVYKEGDAFLKQKCVDEEKLAGKPPGSSEPYDGDYYLVGCNCCPDSAVVPGYGSKSFDGKFGGGRSVKDDPAFGLCA